MKISLKDIIAPSFYGLHKDLKKNRYTHYWLKGGRGSTKSSFGSTEIILGIMQDPKANAVALRKVKGTLKDSVFEQFVWVIDKLGVSEYWHATKSPLEITYLPTGQKILFRGADKPKKIKSTKVSKGYIKYIWYEEVDEFSGPEEIRTINQSLMRGGEQFVVFYTYNPPESIRNWVNNEVLTEREDRKVHHSTYLTVPKEWLGEQFIIEAEHLKKVNEKAYNHEYLGEVTGTGGEIFTNVTVRKITDDEIRTFDKVRRGIDWGYAGDPFHYTVCHYDKTRRKLYIYYEIQKVGLSNRKAAAMIKKENKNNTMITADSAEPKSIDEMKNEHGLRVKGAKKGPGSIEYGIKFLAKEVEEIIIDNERCPNTAREFLGYELEKDSQGNFKSNYPEKDNHSIDAVRYALEDDMTNKKLKAVQSLY
ncbi:PBSX family phage terminase large subunit [Dethiothermospora halolimnae]|uniref:PBSX family phage terminase large subunit n=1 Tax=Dethiothermospora halolimnae TaxID=3114390 RepID=UPI003CCB7BC7